MAQSSQAGGGDAGQAASPKVLQLAGPGGTVAIGGTLDEAKKAFPAPEGADVYQSAMSFTILGSDGWTWGQEQTKEGFEASLKGKKIAAMARATGEGEKEPAATIAQIGEPIRKAESENGGMYVWESGDNARIVVKMGPKNLILANGAITLIGRKEDLALLNYRADDPQMFVKQLDAFANQSPEMKKALDDAFANAKEKAKAERGSGK
jgi:hypothetical protein